MTYRNYETFCGMDLLVLTIGFVASLLTIMTANLSFFKNHKVQQSFFLIVIISMTMVTFYYWQENKKRNDITLAAKKILNTKKSFTSDRLTDAQFIQASLSFLEKNKAYYPDSYKRAEKICEGNRCYIAQYSRDDIHKDGSYIDANNYEYNLKNASESIEGILIGISTLEK